VGYRPRGNFQKALFEAVEAHLNKRPDLQGLLTRDSNMLPDDAAESSAGKAIVFEKAPPQREVPEHGISEKIERFEGREFEAEYGNIYPVATYPMVWDITNDPTVVDGSYTLRAVAEGGKSGYKYSNTVKGTVDRTSMAVFGKPTPGHNGVLRMGDEIVVEFNNNIDCQLMDTSLFSIETLAGTAIDFKVRCSGNKLFFDINDADLEAIHGDTLQITINDVKNLLGNGMAAPYSWSFRVDRSPVSFTEDYVQVFMKRNSEYEYETKVSSSMYQISHFSLRGLDATWMKMFDERGFEISDGKSMLFDDNERKISLKFNSYNKVGGTYLDTLYADMNGHISAHTIFEINVLADPINWSVDASKYNELMHITADLKVDETLVTDTNDMVAAVIDNTIRGVANFTKVGDKHLVYLTVWGTSADNNKPVEFRYWNATKGFEYDAKPNNSPKFKLNRVFGSSASPYHLKVFSATNRVRYIHLDKGWNMFSLNACPKDARFESVFKHLNATQGDVIKDHDKQEVLIEYNVTQQKWVSLSSVDTVTPGFGYWIYLDKANVLRFSGDETKVYNSFNLSKNNGWFLVGGPVQSCQDINKTIKPVAKDKRIDIVSTDGVAEYSNNVWVGSLKEIRPFGAYKVRPKKATILTFENGSSVSGYPESDNLFTKSADKDQFAYSIAPSTYEHNLTIVGEVLGAEKVSVNDKVIAFDAEGKVRGIGHVTYIEETGKHLVPMYVYANDNDKLSFKFYASSTGSEYEVSNELTFNVNDRIGNIAEPYAFMAGDELDNNSNNSAAITASAYPNPFTNMLQLDIETTEQLDATITLYNVLDQKLNSNEMQV
ncbi:MAG: hypothetical protein MI922_01080, partial [Bacteroidales bacterium]|nr:hypothetical protein [Bacteroidales bacterium]